LKRIKLIILGIATALQMISGFASALYIFLLILFGWRAYAVFVPLAGILAMILVYVQGDTEKTLKDFLEELWPEGELSQKMRPRLCSKTLTKIWLTWTVCMNFCKKILKKTFMMFFKVRIFAIVISVFFLAPFSLPIVVNLCMKGSRRVYFWAITLNMAGVAFWIFVYLQCADWLRTISWLQWLLPKTL